MDNQLYSLKDTLCRELASYANVTKLTRQQLHDIDTFAHACKNICKIIKSEEEEGYGEPMEPYSGRTPHMRMSYARGRGANGQYVSREPAYSMHTKEELAEELKDLMHDAPDEAIKQDFLKLIQKVEGV